MVFVSLLCFRNLSPKPFVLPQFLVLFCPLNHSCISFNLATGKLTALKAHVQPMFLTTLANFAAQVSTSPALAAALADNSGVLPKEIQPLSKLDVIEVFDLSWHPIMATRRVYQFRKRFGKIDTDCILTPTTAVPAIHTTIGDQVFWVHKAASFSSRDEHLVESLDRQAVQLLTFCLSYHLASLLFV